MEDLTDFFVTCSVSESKHSYHGLVFVACYLPYLALGPEMDPNDYASVTDAIDASTCITASSLFCVPNSMIPKAR